MHHMGQLWLRAEVRDLESRVRHRGATFSPYLAVDSDALIHHIHLVKQLVGARKFIILIPSVGMYSTYFNIMHCYRGSEHRSREDYITSFMFCTPYQIFE